MSILIATPCYGRVCTEPYLASLLILKKELAAAGIENDILTLGNESLITRGRNVIAASFLYDTDLDHLLFIDADIQCDPADVARLWNLASTGVDIAAGAYRHKNPGSRLAAWVNHKLVDVREFTEPFEVDMAGTGFMLIKRKTFERLIEAHPEWEYDEGFPFDEHKAEPMKCHAFFMDPLVEWEDGRKYHVSEDFYFCQEVKKLGMKIMMDPAIELKHWGMYAY